MPGSFQLKPDSAELSATIINPAGEHSLTNLVCISYAKEAWRFVAKDNI